MRGVFVLDKSLGQTPLHVLQTFQAAHPDYRNIPLAYAGRLDPMASGKLLVLAGDECKKQSYYHALDKEYEFEVLFGIGSDTGDVLGLIESVPAPVVSIKQLHQIAHDLTGTISLPYPAFSSKTVAGKPLHTWALEGRLSEIEIPVSTTRVHSLTVTALRESTMAEAAEQALRNIDSLPTVTDPKKALGADFRRELIRPRWRELATTRGSEPVQIATFRCVCSSGTYMRSLAEIIAQKADTTGLAFSIHRTRIGRYYPLMFGLGFFRDIK